MSRETRANVLFLLIFLAISLPGAFILFKKKLDPAARRMNMPDPAPKRIVYTGTQIIDNAPPALRQWFDDLCVEKSGAPAVRRNGRAAASDNAQLQLISASPARAHLVLWSESADNIRLTGGALQSVDRIPIRKLAITEMVQAAFAAPPGQIIWLQATPNPAATALTVDYDQGDIHVRTSVNLFTNQAATTK